jgi:hypothetical protein
LELSPVISQGLLRGASVWKAIVAEKHDFLPSSQKAYYSVHGLG